MDRVKIEREIKRLEDGGTSWENIERLSMLYNVYDHISDSPPSRMPQCGEGEFCEACNGAKIEPLMAILTEHMAVMKILHPKEYQAVLEKIRGIS